MAIVGGFELGLGQGYAPFTASDTNGGNSLAAAASFPTYPQTVTRDGPLAYYRLDDPVGASTTADSSGNSQPGVLPPAVASDAYLYLPFDEGSGTTSKDRSWSTNDVTTTTAAGWTTGKAGNATSLNGTSSFWATASAVVNTSASFTVGAWVKMNASPSGIEAAVSQTGANESGFRLGYDSGTGKWAFSMPQSDAVAATVDQATASISVSTGTWVYLAGTFDSVAHTMTIYVNGSAAGTATHSTTWNATGVVRIGSAVHNANRAYYWAGAIDEVRLYKSALSGTDVAGLADGTAVGPSTRWRFNENSGTSTVDSSGNLNRGTFGSGATWGASSVALNYTANGYVSAAAPAVATNQSFTVAAWVNLAAAAVSDGQHHVAVSQSGTNAEGFALEYSTSGGGRWEMDMDATDSVGAGVDFAYSTTPVVGGTWVYLVGVYDASQSLTSVYVNGALGAGTHSHTGSFNATRSLQVGRVWEQGGWDTPWAWNGSVDDVQTFQRALSASDVGVLYGRGGSLGPYTPGAPGALQGAQQGQQGSTAVAFSGVENGYMSANGGLNDPTTFTEECWFRSDSLVSGASGATILDFASAASGVPVSSDRRVFLDASGNIVFGSSSGIANTVQTSGTNYLDGAWHYVAATLSPTTGMNLYVDGALAGAGSYNAPGNYWGSWRFGGDTATASFPSGNFLGLLDEVAFYSTALTATQVAEHYSANH